MRLSHGRVLISAKDIPKGNKNDPQFSLLKHLPSNELVQGFIVRHMGVGRHSYLVRFPQWSDTILEISTKAIKCCNSSIAHSNRQKKTVKYHQHSSTLSYKNRMYQSSCGDSEDDLLSYSGDYDSLDMDNNSVDSQLMDHNDHHSNSSASAEGGSSRNLADVQNPSDHISPTDDDGAIWSGGKRWTPISVVHETRPLHSMHIDTKLSPGTKKLSEDSNILTFFEAFFLNERDKADFICFTNRKLRALDRKPMTPREFDIVIGILLRSAQYHGIPLDELFDPIQNDDYTSPIPSPRLSQYMRKSRFDCIINCLSFTDRSSVDTTGSRRVETNPETLVDEVVFQGWFEVDRLIKSFNESRLEYIRPGWNLCIDDSMSKWQDLDSRVADGKPHHLKSMHKPEPMGAELKAIGDCQSGIMLRLELCTPKSEPEQQHELDHQEATSVVMRLCEPWKNSGRTVYGDGAFASESTASSLLVEHGLYFIGPVKTAHAKYPRDYFHSYSWPRKSDGSTIVMSAPIHENVPNNDLYAIAWNDVKLKTFVSTCGSTLEDEPHMRRSWVNNSETNETETRPEQIPRMNVAEYFTYSQTIDTHHRYRQGFLELERIINTRQWRVRIFCTLLGMSITDAFLAYQKFSNNPQAGKMALRRFVESLSVAILTPELHREIRPPSQRRISEGHSDSTREHELRGLTQLNRELDPDIRWKHVNPKVRCKDCKEKSKLASKYCIQCTENARNASPKLERNHVHGVCAQCQYSHNLRRKFSFQSA